jgi:lipopolysaccharide export system permease protein
MTIPLLDRYLWRHLRDLFAFGVAIFTMLLLVNHLFLLARLVLQQGTALSVAFQLLVFKLPYFLAFSFPMAMLLASLLAIGRLSDGQEITAMRTSGISLTRIAVSIVAAGVLVSVLTLALNEGVAPRAEERYRRAFAIALQGPSPTERRDVLFREVQDNIESVYFIRRLLKDAGRMDGVVVNQFEDGTLKRVIEATEAQYLGGVWEFRHGTMYVFTGGTTVVTQFDRLRVGLTQTPQEIALPQRDPSEMSVRELRLYIRVLQRSGENVARYVAQVHFKLAVPLSAALFALLAVPVGLRPHRSGTSIGLGLTFLVLIGYYIISAAALPLGENGRLNPVVAGWLPDLVLAVVGVALLRRVDQ